MSKNIFLICSLLFTSCAMNNGSIIITEAPAETSCTLKENIQVIKMPESFAMADDNSFVLTDMEHVILYGQDGRQIRTIGNSGNATFEYSMPTIVRIHKDTIYVWSSYSLKFITFKMDGTPVAEYEYPSAVNDFIPVDDYILIYTAGKQGENIIDIYSKNDKTVAESLTKATKEHQFLSRNVSPAPMFIDGDKFYYTSKDNLDIISYDLSSHQQLSTIKANSKSFNVAELPDSDLMKKNRDEARKYLRENPFTLILRPSSKNSYTLMTLEGAATKSGDVVSQESRYYGLYHITKESTKPIAYYSFNSIGTQYLLNSNGKVIYFIQHSIEDDNDVYKLKKMDI